MTPYFCSAKSSKPFAVSSLLFYGSLFLGICFTACGTRPNQDLYLLRGNNALMLQRFDWARVYFAKDLEQHPKRAESLRGFIEALGHGDEGSRSKAIAICRRYLNLFPDDHDVRLQLAKWALSMGNRSLCETTLENLPASPAKAMIEAQFWQYEDPKRAFEAAKHGSQGFESSADVLLAVNLALQVSAWEQATLWSDLGLERFPLMPALHYQRARVLEAGNKVEAASQAKNVFQALKATKLATDMSPPQPQKVLQHFENALQGLDPQNPEVKLFQARWLLRNNRWGEGLVIVQAMLNHGNTEPQHILKAAAMARETGAFEVAVKGYQSIQDQHAWQADAWRELGQVHLKSGALEKAIGAFNQALSYAPNDARLANALGHIYLDLGGKNMAKTWLEKALELAPYLVKCRLSLANLYRLDGEKAKLQQLIDQCPEPHPAWSSFLKRYRLEANPS